MATKFEVQTKTSLSGWTTFGTKNIEDKTLAIEIAQNIADVQRVQTRVRKVVTKVAWTSKEPEIESS